MAEADPDSSDTSELVDVKNMFSIPGFFVGFGAKGTPDSDVGRSPTSTLDFGVFANFGGLFSPRSPSPSSPRFFQRNKWVCDKVGLSLLSIGQDDEGLGDSFTRSNIVLAPQIKLNVNMTPKLSSEHCAKNYAAASFSDAVNVHPHPCVDDTNVVSHRRSGSSPMDIISSQAYSCEMALSEDYTCIISHGPNPKTTHIFGDCILDCDPRDQGCLDSKEEVERPKDDDSLPDSPHDSFTQLCFCRGKPQECQGIHIQREVAAEKETEEANVEYYWDVVPGLS